jgi:hypothetical protein
MRSRVAAASRKALACHTLGGRTAAALEMIAKSKKVSVAMEACHTLETCTRISPVCCAMFAEKGIVSTVLALIRSCNRSQPHQEMVRCEGGECLRIAYGGGGWGWAATRDATPRTPGPTIRSDGVWRARLRVSAGSH